MAKGSLKHKILVKEGKYNVPTKEEQNIIALSDEFDDLKNKNAHLTAQLNEKRQKSKKPKVGAADGDKWAWKKVPTTVALSTSRSWWVLRTLILDPPRRTSGKPCPSWTNIL